MKRIFVLTALLAVTFQLSARDLSRYMPDRTIVFAQYDTLMLGMDVYLPNDGEATHKCMVYTYGGGFMDNNQRARSTMEFCRTLADRDHFVVVAIDYRLGLKGFVSKGTLSMVKPLENSVKMAAEDLFKAVKVILDNAQALTVDPNLIILCGSSAGAITSLQADYELCHRTPMTAQMDEDFRFAGVISFAGAVFSREGKCTYPVHAPAPTFFLHGKSDKLVTYGKIAFFNMRFSGSDDLVKQFKKNNYPHEIMRFVDEGHGVAARMMDNYDDVIWFVDNMVLSKRGFEIDQTVWDKDHKRTSWDKSGPGALYK